MNKALKKWIKARKKEFKEDPELVDDWEKGYDAGWRTCLRELKEEMK